MMPPWMTDLEPISYGRSMLSRSDGTPAATPTYSFSVDQQLPIPMAKTTRKSVTLEGLGSPAD